MEDNYSPPRKTPRLEESEKIRIVEGSSMVKSRTSSGLSIFENLDKGELFVDLLITNSNDVEFLKKCRFVNREWNKLACGKLQKLSMVKVDEEDERLDELISVLLDRSLGNLAIRPFPFKEFHIISTKFMNYEFIQLIRSEAVVITKWSLEICEEENMDVETAKELLKLHQSTITTLIIAKVTSSVVESLLKGIRFSSVKTLIVETECLIVGDHQTCHHMNALKNALKNSALSSLTITISTANCFQEFLQMDLSQIKQLKLRLVMEQRFGDGQRFKEIEVPTLERLYLFRDSGFVNNGFFHLWLNGLVGNVASTLTKLSHNFTDELQMNFPFLRLTSIKLAGRTFSELLTLITHDRFPYLQNVHLTSCTVDHMNIFPLEIHTLKGFSPHLGIRKLGISIKKGVVQMELQKFFFLWLLELKRLFPNIEDIRVSYKQKGWTSYYLMYVYSVFPNLKTIRINSTIDFEALAGTVSELYNNCLLSGIVAENIPRRNSLFDFKELEKLILGPSVSNELLEMCLCRLPRLKHIRFPWSSDISTEGFTNNFQHLRKLEITYFDEPTHQLSALRQWLPYCVVKMYEIQAFGKDDEDEHS